MVIPVDATCTNFPGTFSPTSVTASSAPISEEHLPSYSVQPKPEHVNRSPAISISQLAEQCRAPSTCGCFDTRVILITCLLVNLAMDVYGVYTYRKSLMFFLYVIDAGMTILCAFGLALRSTVLLNSFFGYLCGAALSNIAGIPIPLMASYESLKPFLPHDFPVDQLPTYRIVMAVMLAIFGLFNFFTAFQTHKVNKYHQCRETLRLISA